MDIDTISYAYESVDGRFTIKPRLSRRWRVKHNGHPWGDSFTTAEEAAKAVAAAFAVPEQLSQWSEVGDYHTELGGLIP
jgi:hypothetical protein